MEKNNLLVSLLGILLLVGFINCSSGTGVESDPDPDPDPDPTDPVEEQALAFPGAEGFGQDVTGGRGGDVIYVTNLNDSGEGSLRAAVETFGARYILFKVSGTIELASGLDIKNGDVTIAGQTAPGDGITIKNHPVRVSADNVIIRFLRFRMGDIEQVENDALWGRYNEGIIIDHCSMSWSTDETASFYANRDFTLQWSIISESLNNSIHDKGSHGYGAIWGGDHASFHHNLLAHHKSRNPRFNGGGRSGTDNGSIPNEHVDYRNNVIYNWRDESAYGGENGTYNMVNNYYKPGPATPDSKKSRIMRVSSESDKSYGPGYGQFYIEGNYVVNGSTVTGDNWNGVIYDGDATQEEVELSEPIDYLMDHTHTAEEAYEKVLDYAGASYKRDLVDARVVEEVRDGTATYNGSVSEWPGIIDSQQDVEGWPELESEEPPTDIDNDGMPDEWETDNGLDPNTANANGRDLSTAYDNVEVYINSLVTPIVTEQNQ